MKFTCEVEIDLGIERVVELFQDPENIKYWQPGLLKREPISGENGLPGSKARMTIRVGSRDIEMIETITVRNPPHEFSGTYDAKGVFNVVSNYFSPITPHKTKYVSQQEFRFSGFMKAIGVMMPDLFRKTSLQLMSQFKEFAEKSVLH